MRPLAELGFGHWPVIAEGFKRLACLRVKPAILQLFAPVDLGRLLGLARRFRYVAYGLDRRRPNPPDRRDGGLAHIQAPGPAMASAAAYGEPQSMLAGAAFVL